MNKTTEIITWWPVCVQKKKLFLKAYKKITKQAVIMCNYFAWFVKYFELFGRNRTKKKTNQNSAFFCKTKIDKPYRLEEPMANTHTWQENATDFMHCTHMGFIAIVHRIVDCAIFVFGFAFLKTIYNLFGKLQFIFRYFFNIVFIHFL